MNHRFTCTPIGNDRAHVDIESTNTVLEMAMNFLLAAYNAERLGIDLDLTDTPIVAVTIEDVFQQSSSIHPIVVNHSEFMLVVFSKYDTEREPEESEAHCLLLERYVAEDSLFEWRIPEGAKLVHLISWEDVGLEPLYGLSAPKLLNLLMD